MPYKVFATADNGNGYVQSLGVYDEIEDIELYTNIIAPNVKITIEEVYADPPEYGNAHTFSTDQSPPLAC